jgi:hypothetical protein
MTMCSYFFFAFANGKIFFRFDELSSRGSMSSEVERRMSDVCFFPTNRTWYENGSIMMDRFGN